MKKMIVILAVMFASSCNSKKEAPKNFISIQSFIVKQVAHVDSSLYSIRKIIILDSIHADTTYIARENFKAAAQEFLEIPDLSVQKIAKRYKEEEPRYDEMMGRAIISYSAIKPEKEEYISQEILVTPNLETGDKVNNIIVKRVYKIKDTLIQKNLLWQMDRSFQITTTRELPNKPSTTVVEKVIWNEKE